jgi:hypothetical protein
MYKNNYQAPAVPTANIAVNKSRIKLYTKGLDMPTYYLQKGQEFQIELFNPTSDVLLAKIILNGKAISQGGLVLNPGQRVFLDRYFDVAKKFLFDTYEVANTSEVKKAIENNGDIKIEFYKERMPVIPYFNPQTWISTQPIITTFNSYDSSSNSLRNLSNLSNPKETLSSTGNITTNGMVNNSTPTAVAVAAAFTSSVSDMPVFDRSFGDMPTFDMPEYDMSASLDFSPTLEEPAPMLKKSVRAKKSIETGRVEQGSYSDQKFKTVNKEFDYFPFHTVEYKMMPVSQKVNTLSDVNVKVYCTNCGHKLGKTDKFCSSCGTKA